MKRAGIIALLFTAFLAHSASAADGYWVWVDKNGVTNYSQQKPRDHPARHVVGTGPYGYDQTLEDSRRPGMAPPPPKATPKPPPPETTSKKKVDPDKLIAAQKAKIQRQLAEQKRKNCEQARANLKTLQRPRIRSKSSDGQVFVMSPQEKQSRIEQAQQAIRANCGG